MGLTLSMKFWNTDKMTYLDYLVWVVSKLTFKLVKDEYLCIISFDGLKDENFDGISSSNKNLKSCGKLYFVLESFRFKFRLKY